MRKMIIIIKGFNYWVQSLDTAAFVEECEKKFANPNETILRSEKGNENQHNANEKEGK